MMNFNLTRLDIHGPADPRLAQEADMGLGASVLSDIMPCPLYFKRTDGIFLDCNPAFAAMVIGKPKSQIIGRSVFDLSDTIPRETAEFYHQQDLKLLRNGGDLVYEAAVKCADGKTREFLFKKSLQTDEQGNPLGIMGVMVDMSERNLAEEALLRRHERLEQMVEKRTAELKTANERIRREIQERNSADEARRYSEEKLRVAFETSPDAITIHHAEDGAYVEVNQGFSHLTGYLRDEVVGKRVRDVGIWKDLEKLKNLQHKICEHGEVRDFEARFVVKDGTIHTGLVTAKTIQLNGKPHILSITRDISAYKLAQEQLLQSEQIYRTLFENTGAATILIEEDMTISMANAKAEALSGYRKAEIEGRMRTSDLLVPKYVEQIRLFHQMRHNAIGQIPQQYELKLKNKNGEIRDILGQIERIPGSHQSVASLIDITELKAAEQEQLRMAAVIEQSSEGTLIIDPHGLIQYVNPAFEALSGYTQREITGRTMADFFKDQEDAEVFARLTFSVEAQDVWHGRVDNLRKDGSTYTAETRISPIFNRKGRVISFVVTKRDVTSEISMQRQLHQAQKMEAIGTLAGGIAHDFNNILAGIIGYTEMCIKQAPAESPLPRRLDCILQASLRAKDLVNQILTFCRRRDDEHKPLKIHPIVKEALKFLRATIPATIRFKQYIQSDIGLVKADPTQIHQLVMNIAANAAYAMQEKGGTLTVKLEDVSLGEARDMQLADLPAGPYVRLTMGDTGHGMPPEVVERIFEPYFTTKPQGEGTGLGLSVVHGIVKAHGGHLIVKSVFGRGATFEIYLPQVQAPCGVAGDVACDPPRGSERILVVDDEELVRDILCEMLKDLGYQTQGSSSSRETLEMLQASPDCIDLLVADHIMPHMTGEKLAARLHKIRPQLPIIICTGFNADLSKKRLEKAGIGAVIQKPVLQRDIAWILRRLLDGADEKDAKASA